MWDFTTPEKEAECLADFVKKQMAEYGLAPRDFSILVRQKAADYMKVLEPRFAARGLYLRNEAAQVGPIALQELLAEDASEIILTVLRLLTSARAGRHWTECVESICMMRGLALDDESGRAKVVRSLNEFCAQFQERHGASRDEPSSRAIMDDLIKFIGRGQLLSLSPAYRQGDWFDKVLEGATLHLDASSRGATDWSYALDVYEGVHAVPP